MSCHPSSSAMFDNLMCVGNKTIEMCHNLSKLIISPSQSQQKYVRKMQIDKSYVNTETVEIIIDDDGL